MDRQSLLPGRNHDSSKLRRTQSIAASSKLRRTQTISAAKPITEDSSISSLGSFPEADLVAQQFTPTSAKLSRQQTVAAPGPIFSASSRDPHRTTSYHHSSSKKPRGGSGGGGGNDLHRISSHHSSHHHMQVHQKQCPHCYKEFSNSWAVPKHVQRIHDRTGQYHCPRCTFKTPYTEWLAQHEKDSHRKCPYCRQLFVLLNKHVNSCPKRPR